MAYQHHVSEILQSKQDFVNRAKKYTITSELRNMTLNFTKKRQLKRKAIYSKNNFVSDQTTDQSPTAERRRDNLKLIFNHTSIIPFKWKSKYACYYCDEMYTEYAKFRKHTLSHVPCSKRLLKRLRTYEVKVDVSEIICQLCQTDFHSFSAVVDHLIQSHCKIYDKSVDIQLQEYKLRDLRCLLCDKQFCSFKVLASHMHSTHSKNRFECNDCGRKFTSAASITLHIRKHHVAQTYICLHCSKRFVDETKLKRHELRIHKLQCSNCDAKFKYAASLKKHIAREHTNDACTKCRYCSKEFVSAVEIKLHLYSCEVKKLDQKSKTDDPHSNKGLKRNALCHQIRQNIQCVLNTSTAVPFKFKGKFCCFYCSHWFTDFNELILHTRTLHPVCELKSKAMLTCKGEKARVKLDINSLACKLCHLPMPDLNSFVDHAIVEHGASYDKSVPFKQCFEVFHLTQGRIPCPECQRPFAYFATLLKHLGAEHNHHKAVCAYCGRGFRTTTSLAMHITNSHTGMCECSICNAKCKNSAALARHMARFHDAKDYKCPQCPEQFETIYKKQNHLIKAHNVGHKCGYCSKMFTKNSFMMNHVRRTHLKERTVPCSVCHVKFFDSYHLRLHMVKHEGIRMFRCEVCGKSFMRVRNLKSHMETHKKGYLSVNEIN